MSWQLVASNLAQRTESLSKPHHPMSCVLSAALLYVSNFLPCTDTVCISSLRSGGWQVR